MEKYFKPVHSQSNLNKSKAQKHYSQHQHQHQEPGSHRYTTCDDADRNTDECYGHRYNQHGHYYHNNVSPDVHICHQAKQFPHSEEEFVYNRTNASVTLSRASSSSLSSSSTSLSSTSWFTEASANDVFSQRHAERPQHSLSCSNIHDARRFYQPDDNTDPIVFATIKHGSNGSVCSERHGATKKKKQDFAPLDRGHSRSDEGFLQENERKRAKSHLNQSLGFSEEDIMLGVSKGPKRAVSSSQLPSKGILKNKEPHSDIRKAKSMEVLSPRVAKEPKGIAQVDIAQARAHFVKEKMKFSAFLDEITKQVISPSDLKILGVNSNKTTGQTPLTQTPDPIKPQLPPKKHRESSVEEKEQKQYNKHVKAASNSARKHSDSANSDRLTSYDPKNHHGSPPPNPPYTSHSTKQKSSRKDRRPLCTKDSGERYERSGPHLTDGTSTSPELIQPRQQHKQQPRSPLSHTQHRGLANSLPSSTHGSGVGLGSESSSSKSDSSRTRDTISTATSSDQNSRYHSQHAALSEQHRGTQCDADLQALQEENADLHQNLLQTVVCIESLEAELQRTRDELIHVKEKYKSLLETHSGAQQANNFLQEHLHVEAESLSSERQYMFNHVAQLTSELQDARRTIAALENINVPSLIKELLEKHFFTSAEAKQQPATTQFNHLMSSPKTDNQSNTPKVEEASYDWLSKSEAGPQRPTAFTPFKLLPATENQSWISGSHSTCSPLFSVADISTAIYKKMAAGYAARPQPLCAQPLLGTTTADNPSVQQAPVGGDNCAGKAVEDVTAMSAQQILNDFMQQLQAQKEPDRDLMQQEEWGAGAAEQTGRVDKR